MNGKQKHFVELIRKWLLDNQLPIDSPFEYPQDAANQCFMRGQFAGYSINDLLTVWEHETGFKVTRTYDEFGNYL